MTHKIRTSKNQLAIFLFILFFVPARILSQNIHIPNSNFEVWDNLQGLIDVPDSWPSSDLVWFSKGLSTRNVYRDTHAHSGKYAAHIGPDTAAKKIWPGFMAARFGAHLRVKYLSLYYVDSLNAAENGVIQVSLFKGNANSSDSIGGATWRFPDSVFSDYRYVDIPISYSGTDTTIIPDSVSVTIEVYSSATAVPSGHVVVDDIGLSVDKKAGISIPVSPVYFMLFPNPSNGIFQWVGSGPMQDKSILVLSDITGKIMYNRIVNNDSPEYFDFSAYPVGTYLLKWMSGENSSVNRLIITH